MKSLVALVLVLLLASASPLAAQETTGNLQGQIVDESGKPIPWANVVARGPSLQGIRGVIAGPDGFFRILGLPVGVYTVQFMHISHQEKVYQDVRIWLGATTSLEKIRLSEAVHEMPEVVVVAERPLIDPVSTEVKASLSAETLASLPTERDYRAVISYLPHTNTSYYGDGTNISGATGTENAFIVDGFNVTDPFMAEFSTRLPQNFIKDLEVKAGGYEAEYGRATGGVVNVITHTGGNRFEGQVFGYLTNKSLAANEYRGLVALPQDRFQRYDVGASLQGPITRDKLWYFVAYDPTFELEDLAVPDFGFQEDRLVAHQFAAKLTWKANPTTRFDLVTFGDPTRHDRIGHNWFEDVAYGLENPDPFLGKWTTGGVNVAVKGQKLWRSRFILDGQVSRFDSRHKVEPATERGRMEPTFQDWTTGIWSGGFGNTFDRHAVRTAGRLVGTFFTNRHELKAGLEYEDNLADVTWYWTTADGEPGYVAKFGESYYYSMLYVLDHDVRHRIPSAFVQDSWRVTERLNVSPGLRWDGLYVVDANGDIALKIEDQFQPRVGFSYQLGEIGSQRVFGSYGRFYEQLPMLLSSGTFGPVRQLIFESDIDPRLPGAVVDTTDFSIDSWEKVEGLKGQHFDEFVLGYERRVGRVGKVAIRGIRRDLKEVIEDTVNTTTNTFDVGNPGRGRLSHLPDPVHQYTAGELTVEMTSGDRYRIGGSYVLSRTEGNYTGVFNTDSGVANPNWGPAFDYPEQYVNAEGLLPNDRRHVFKLYGSYRSRWNVTGGAFVTWQSGTPLSERIAGNDSHLMFLTQRGSAGRAPSIWDLNLRLAYEIGPVGDRLRPRVLLDVFHAFSQRKGVEFDQVRYLELDALGNPTTENPNFGSAILFQPPMTVRVGFETGF